MTGEAHAASRGFTLLESLIALLVLATGLLGLAQLLALAVGQNAYSRQSTMAVSVAADRLEELKSRYNNDLSTGETSTMLSTGTHGPITVSVAGASARSNEAYEYSVTWTVVSSGGNEKDITVRVEPVTSGGQQNRSVQLNAHLAP